MLIPSGRFVNSYCGKPLRMCGFEATGPPSTDFVTVSEFLYLPPYYGVPHFEGSGGAQLKGDQASHRFKNLNLRAQIQPSGSSEGRP
jgi:hypothetical protein